MQQTPRHVVMQLSQRPPHAQKLFVPIPDLCLVMLIVYSAPPSQLH